MESYGANESLWYEAVDSDVTAKGATLLWSDRALFKLSI
jgi:hypothetical protein